ncbi:hypothetical protein ACFO7E_01615 [Cupriavidus pampae]
MMNNVNQIRKMSLEQAHRVVGGAPASAPAAANRATARNTTIVNVYVRRGKWG